MARRLRSARAVTALAATTALIAGVLTAMLAGGGAAGAAPAAHAAPTAPAAPAKPAVASAAEAASLRTALRNGTIGAKTGVLDVCAAVKARCGAQVLTSSPTSHRALSQQVPAGGVHSNAFAPPIGYGADELAKAYGLTKASSRTGTIVVIGAGAYPTLESDLSIYRQTYNLPACTTDNGCFKQINYTGGKPYKPATNENDQFAEEDLAVETALDVDMASAGCPKCKIVSMQVPVADGSANNPQALHDAVLHFATGVQTAKKLGASAVSISYGYPIDYSTDTGKIKQLMTQPGLPIVASSGDSGFSEDEGIWPQNLATVTSAGGTSLYTDAKSGTGFTETAWDGAGSSCDPLVSPATGQPKSVSSACDGHRASSDLSADANPDTGVAVYDSYAPFSGFPEGFIVVGGTSASSPFLAGLYARAPKNDSVLGPNTVYAAPSSAFTDVTVGSNAAPHQCETSGFDGGYDPRLCNSGPGWDGPTGRGTPKGLAPFAGATG